MMILTAFSLLAPLASPAPLQVTAPANPSVDSLGGQLQTSVMPPLSGSTVAGRMLEITMNLPGQTWQERFVVGIPAGMQTPAPVLTLFHGYGEEPLNVLQNTTLAQDAMARGWLVFIPLGAHKFNYGIDYAQENIRLAFEFIGSRLPIDMERIYGVGFSMGGGAAASYAARHLDPSGLQFAAIVNHTGTTSLRATYHTSNDYNLFESPLMFDGTPDTAPFGYLRSSTVDLDPILGTVDPNGALGSNLKHIPVRHWYATMDANSTIIDQTLALDDQLRKGGGDTETVPRSFSIHSWSTLDNAAVLDWLEAQTLRVPAAGDISRTVADRDGRWHDLTIRQETPGELTPILWTAQPQTNLLYLIDAENLSSVALDPSAMGLDDAAPLSIVLQTKDDAQTSVVLQGIDQMPSDVQLRGSATPTWSYDAQTRELTLEELDQVPGWTVWTVIP